MSVVLKHRGPDDEGFAINDPNGNPNFFKGNDTIDRFSDLQHISEANFTSQNQLGLVHRRLSILDLSPAGHQPMTYKNGNYQIVFNGEIYNYKEIKAELSGGGYQFVSDSKIQIG